MENIYIDNIADKKALLLCSKLGMFTTYYGKNTTYDSLLPQDKVAFAKMRHHIENNLKLLAVSGETIDRHIEQAMQFFDIDKEQAQTLISGQTSFLITSADNWQYYINGIQNVFGTKPKSFEELLQFSEIMFQRNENLQQTADAYQRIGITKEYCLSHKSILTATPFSIEAKYMFGVVNGLEDYNLPHRQDLIRQNFNKTVARHTYLQQINQTLVSNGLQPLPANIIFDRDEEFMSKVGVIVKDNKSLFASQKVFDKHEDMLKALRPTLAYLRKLQDDYQQISSTTFEGDDLKYPMIVLSNDYEQQVLDGLTFKVTQQERDQRAQELQELFDIPIEQARRMVKQNSNLMIYSDKVLKQKISEWSKFFGCEKQEIIGKFVKRPTLINYDIQTIQNKSSRFSLILGMTESDFRQVFLDNLEIATEDCSKFGKKISDLKQLGFSNEHITEHLKEVVRLSYGIKEKFMITQIVSSHAYQNPRVAGHYQDFNKYFFNDENVDKIGRTSLALLYAKFRFFYDGIQSEDDDKLSVPQAFNTYFINTKDLIKQYAQTIGQDIPGFEVDKERTLLADIPELGLKKGDTFETLYPVLQAELIKKYPFDEQAYELLEQEYNKLENVPPIQIVEAGQDVQEDVITITPQERVSTITAAAKSAQNIIEGGQCQDE